MKARLMISLVVLLIAATEGKLLFTVWITRHGARGTDKKYNITEKNSGCFCGKDRLTKVGQRQHYILGRCFRNYYKRKFEISPAAVVIRSTGWPRTIQSALSFLYGMVKPTSYQTLSKGKRIPFEISDAALELYANTFDSIPRVGEYPIYQMRGKGDNLGFPAAGCKNLRQISKDFMKSKRFKTILKNVHKRVKPIMKKIYGENWKDDFISKLSYLDAALYHNLPTIPRLTKKEGQIISKARYAMHSRYRRDYVPLQKTNSHYYLKQIKALFEYAVSKDKLGAKKFQKKALKYHKKLARNDPAYVSRYNFIKMNPGIASDMKAMIFSSHDATMIYVILALTTMDHSELYVPYASALSLELHKRKTKGNSKQEKYYVTIRYNNEKAIFKHCLSSKCNLTEFLGIVDKEGMHKNDEEFKFHCNGGFLQTDEYLLS